MLCIIANHKDIQQYCPKPRANQAFLYKASHAKVSTPDNQLMKVWLPLDPNPYSHGTKVITD